MGPTTTRERLARFAAWVDKHPILMSGLMALFAVVSLVMIDVLVPVEEYHSSKMEMDPRYAAIQAAHGHVQILDDVGTSPSLKVEGPLPTTFDAEGAYPAPEISGWVRYLETDCATQKVKVAAPLRAWQRDVFPVVYVDAHAFQVDLGEQEHRQIDVGHPCLASN